MFNLTMNGYVGILTISRPEALNALNTAALDELYSVASDIALRDDVRCLVITGEGKAFVAGADIAEMKNLNGTEGLEFGMRGHRAFCAVESLPMPVIAAVNGFALGGGCELALCADIRIAGERAKFGQPETGLGITPGFGGTQRLARTVGVSNALEMILSAKTITAAEAERIGLVNRVVPQESLMEETLKLAQAIAANAPVAVRSSKALARRFTSNNLAEDLRAEAELFGRCFETEDQKMAMEAFVAKSPKSEFTGK